MDTAQIEQILMANLPLQEVHVEGQDAHFSVIVVSDELATLSRLKQQQTIYAPLMDHFASGEIHALSIRMFNSEKWRDERGLNGY